MTLGGPLTPGEVTAHSVAFMRVRKAVIPAAGLGTRFLPATKSTPKEMLPLVDKPGIQYVVEEAVRAGITDILIVTGRSKKTIEDHFDRSPELEASLERSGKEAVAKQMRAIAEMADVHFVRQHEARGLGVYSYFTAAARSCLLFVYTFVSSRAREMLT